MAHDGMHGHRHGDGHGDGHGHGHGHENGHGNGHERAGRRPAGPGHNAPGPAPLHSHLDPADEAADLQALTAQFVEGFVAATDKAAFLRLTGVPTEIAGEGRAPSLRLVDVRLVTEWQVATASSAFGSDELSYLPYPGAMIAGRTDLALVYVSLRERREVDLRAMLRALRKTEEAPPGRLGAPPPAAAAAMDPGGRPPDA